MTHKFAKLSQTLKNVSGYPAKVFLGVRYPWLKTMTQAPWGPRLCVQHHAEDQRCDAWDFDHPQIVKNGENHQEPSRIEQFLRSCVWMELKSIHHDPEKTVFLCSRKKLWLSISPKDLARGSMSFQWALFWIFGVQGVSESWGYLKKNCSCCILLYPVVSCCILLYSVVCKWRPWSFDPWTNRRSPHECVAAIANFRHAEVVLQRERVRNMKIWLTFRSRFYHMDKIWQDADTIFYFKWLIHIMYNNLSTIHL